MFVHGRALHSAREGSSIVRECRCRRALVSLISLRCLVVHPWADPSLPVRDLDPCQPSYQGRGATDRQPRGRGRGLAAGGRRVSLTAPAPVGAPGMRGEWGGESVMADDQTPRCQQEGAEQGDGWRAGGPGAETGGPVRKRGNKKKNVAACYIFSRPHAMLRPCNIGSRLGGIPVALHPRNCPLVNAQPST